MPVGARTAGCFLLAFGEGRLNPARSILVCFGSTCAHSLAVLYSAAGAFTHMPPETGSHLDLDIAHVLFVDVVGYSKLLIDEQRTCSRN